MTLGKVAGQSMWSYPPYFGLFSYLTRTGKNIQKQAKIYIVFGHKNRPHSGPIFVFVVLDANVIHKIQKSSQAVHTIFGLHVLYAEGPPLPIRLSGQGDI